MVYDDQQDGDVINKKDRLPFGKSTKRYRNPMAVSLEK